MVIHPPMLYMGYVGFSVAFAFAIAALIGGRLDATWARWSRPWTTLAWSFLTIGIALGSWWAYYELGWGGWWFWDPVENASFMPWLVGTALIHSLAVTEKRGSVQELDGAARDHRVLAVAARHLPRALRRADVGARVRDRSAARRVHPRASSCSSSAARSRCSPGARRRSALGGRFDARLARDAAARATTCCWSSPRARCCSARSTRSFLDALNLGKISVGPPYFDAVFVPLMAPLVFLMGVGPLARWKEARLPDLWRRLRWALARQRRRRRCCCRSLPAAGRRWSRFGLLLAFWIVATTVVNVRERLRGVPRRRSARSSRAQPRSYWGMMVAHLGIAVFIIGVTLVKGYEIERDVQHGVGDTRRRSAATRSASTASTRRRRARTTAPRAARRRQPRRQRTSTTLRPEKRIYNAGGMPMTEAAIDTACSATSTSRSASRVDGGAWSVRVYHKPFVDWIWGGCCIMALGGFLALTDRRYRVARAARRRDRRAAPPAAR